MSPQQIKVINEIKECIKAVDDLLSKRSQKLPIFKDDQNNVISFSKYWELLIARAKQEFPETTATRNTAEIKRATEFVNGYGAQLTQQLVKFAEDVATFIAGTNEIRALKPNDRYKAENIDKILALQKLHSNLVGIAKILCSPDNPEVSKKLYQPSRRSSVSCFPIASLFKNSDPSNFGQFIPDVTDAKKDKVISFFKNLHAAIKSMFAMQSDVYFTMLDYRNLLMVRQFISGMCTTKDLDLKGDEIPEALFVGLIEGREYEYTARYQFERDMNTISEWLFKQINSKQFQLDAVIRGLDTINDTNMSRVVQYRVVQYKVLKKMLDKNPSDIDALLALFKWFHSIPVPYETYNYYHSDFTNPGPEVSIVNRIDDKLAPSYEAAKVFIETAMPEIAKLLCDQISKEALTIADVTNKLELNVHNQEMRMVILYHVIDSLLKNTENTGSTEDLRAAHAQWVGKVESMAVKNTILTEQLQDAKELQRVWDQTAKKKRT